MPVYLGVISGFELDVRNGREAGLAGEKLGTALFLRTVPE